MKPDIEYDAGMFNKPDATERSRYKYALKMHRELTLYIEYIKNKQTEHGKIKQKSTEKRQVRD